MLRIISLGLLWASRALIPIGIEDSFGMSWLVYKVGGICLGALGVFSMLPYSLVRDQAKLVHAQLWWSFLITFFIKARWTLVGRTFT